MRIAAKILSIWALALMASVSPAKAADPALRFDGIYQHKEEGKPVSSYLRFYADGTALSTSSTGTPEQISKWFNRESKGGAGYFTAEKDLIRITTFDNKVRNECAGTIEKDALILQCGDSEPVRFEFLPMKLSK
jgi:hypothetical protein